MRRMEPHKLPAQSQRWRPPWFPGLRRLVTLVNQCDRLFDVVPQFQDLFTVGEYQMRLHSRLLDESSSDQFAENERSQRRSVQDFLSGVRPERDGALELEWPAAVIGDQKTTDEAFVGNFHRRQESEPQLVWFAGGSHDFKVIDLVDGAT